MSNHNDREVLPLFLYNTWAEMEVQCQEIERFIEELKYSIKEQISVLESKKTELSDIKHILDSLRNLEKSKLVQKHIEDNRKIQSIEADDSAQIIISQENSHALEVRGASAPLTPHLEQNPKPSSDELSQSDSPTQEALTIPPQDMLRPQFKNMVQRRMLQQILESFDRKVHVREIAEIAYDCETKDDLVRCANSISTTLRSGAGKYWDKEGSCYCRLGLLEAQSHQLRNGEVKPQKIERYGSREVELQRVREVIDEVRNGSVYATNGHR